MGKWVLFLLLGLSGACVFAQVAPVDDVMDGNDVHWDCMQAEPVMVENPDYNPNDPPERMKQQYAPVSYFFHFKKENRVVMEILFAGYYDASRRYECALMDLGAPVVRCLDNDGKIFVSYMLNDKAPEESMMYDGDQLEEGFEMSCVKDNGGDHGRN